MASPGEESWGDTLRKAAVGGFITLATAGLAFAIASIRIDANHEARIEELEGKMVIAREWLQRLEQGQRQ